MYESAPEPLPSLSLTEVAASPVTISPVVREINGWVLVGSAVAMLANTKAENNEVLILNDRIEKGLCERQEVSIEI